MVYTTNLLYPHQCKLPHGSCRIHILWYNHVPNVTSHTTVKPECQITAERAVLTTHPVHILSVLRCIITVRHDGLSEWLLLPTATLALNRALIATKVTDCQRAIIPTTEHTRLMWQCKLQLMKTMSQRDEAIMELMFIKQHKQYNQAKQKAAMINIQQPSSMHKHPTTLHKDNRTMSYL